MPSSTQLQQGTLSGVSSSSAYREAADNIAKPQCVCGWMQLSEEENKTDLTLVVDSQDKRLQHTNSAASAGPGSLLMGRVDKLRGVFSNGANYRLA